MIDRMKVTALIPDKLVQTVKAKTHGKNITDALVIALKEWLALKQVIALNDRIARHPLRFSKGFSASKVRLANRGL